MCVVATLFRGKAKLLNQVLFKGDNSGVPVNKKLCTYRVYGSTSKF